MSEAKIYSPIGQLYHVVFVDGQGYYWEHVVAIPPEADVALALEIISEAYPGRKVKEVKHAGWIHHGRIGRQKYGKQEETK
jgi:hypothetical protein